MDNDAKRMQKFQEMIVGYVLWAEKTIPQNRIKLKRFFNECFLMFIAIRMTLPQLLREFGGSKKAHQSVTVSERDQDDVVKKIYENSEKNIIIAVELIRNRPGYPREEYHERFYQIARLYQATEQAQQEEFEAYLHTQLASDRTNQIWAVEMLSTLLRAKKIHSSWRINEEDLKKKYGKELKDLTKRLYDGNALDDWIKNNSLIILLGDMEVGGIETYLLEIAGSRSKLLRAALMSLIKIRPELALGFLPGLYSESEKRLRSDLSFGFGSLGYSTFSELAGLLYYLYGCKYLIGLAEGIHALDNYDRTVAEAFFRTLLETSIGTRIYQWYQNQTAPHPGLVTHAAILSNRKGVSESWLNRRKTILNISKIFAKDKNLQPKL